MKTIKIKTGAHSIAELFYYGVTTILFQRNVYPRGEFRRIRKWGMPVMDTSNTDLAAYLKRAMGQVKLWTVEESLHNFALLIVDANNEIVERWHFGIDICSGDDNLGTTEEKEHLRQSFQAILRQVTTTITVLPLLRGRHTFKLVVETRSGDVEAWSPTANYKLDDPQCLELSTIKVGKQKLETHVEYRVKYI